MKVVLVIISIFLLSCESFFSDKDENGLFPHDSNLKLNLSKIPEEIDELYLWVFLNDTIYSDELNGVRIYSSAQNSNSQDSTINFRLSLEQNNEYEFVVSSSDEILEINRFGWNEYFWNRLYFGKLKTLVNGQNDIDLTIRRVSNKVFVNSIDSTSNNISLGKIDVKISYNIQAPYDLRTESVDMNNNFYDFYQIFPNHAFIYELFGVNSYLSSIELGKSVLFIDFFISYQDNSGNTINKSYRMDNNGMFYYLNQLNTKYTFELIIQDDINNGSLNQKLVVNFITEFDDEITFQESTAISE